MLISICKYIYIEYNRFAHGLVQVKRLWRAILRRDFEMAVNWFHDIRLCLSLSKCWWTGNISVAINSNAIEATPSNLVDHCLNLNRGH